jgi:hypothetical protein
MYQLILRNPLCLLLGALTVIKDTLLKSRKMNVSQDHMLFRVYGTRGQRNIDIQRIIEYIEDIERPFRIIRGLQPE